MVTRLAVQLGITCLLAVQLLAADDDEKKSAEAPPAETARPQAFEGQVFPAAEIVKTHSKAADDDALKISRVLKASDGKVYSLVKDANSRKLFLDDQLLRRPLKITAVQIPGSQLLVVSKVQSIVDGKLHDVDYWCEQCQLPATEPGLCKCCGNAVELRLLPVNPKPSTPSPKR